MRLSQFIHNGKIPADVFVNAVGQKIRYNNGWEQLLNGKWDPTGTLWMFDEMHDWQVVGWSVAEEIEKEYGKHYRLFIAYDLTGADKSMIIGVRLDHVFVVEVTCALCDGPSMAVNLIISRFQGKNSGNPTDLVEIQQLLGIDFKVGDKVRVLSKSSCFYNKIGRIIEINGTDCLVRLDGIDGINYKKDELRKE